MRTPTFPDLAIAVAALIAPPARRDQLLRIAALVDSRQSPKVIITTPARFLRPDKLANRQGAYSNLLNVIETVASRSRVRRLSVGLMLPGGLAGAPASARLVLSHHTIGGQPSDALTASGVRVLHFKTGDLPGSTTFDPAGFAGWSSLSGRRVEDLDLRGASSDEVDAFFEATRREILAAGLTKYPQCVSDEPPLPPRYVFVALQTIGDMVQRAAYIPMLKMLDMVVRTYKDSGIAVVVKRHPKCRSLAVAAALRAVSKHHAHVRISARPIHQLLCSAEALFTVNSGVGSEAMIHERPIYLFGRADYDAIAHVIRSAESLQRLALPPRPAVDASELKAFYYYYRNFHQARGAKALAARIDAILCEVFGPVQENNVAASG